MSTEGDGCTRSQTPAPRSGLETGTARVNTHPELCHWSTTSWIARRTRYRMHYPSIEAYRIYHYPFQLTHPLLFPAVGAIPVHVARDVISARVSEQEA
jgi:hypothetical protein